VSEKINSVTIQILTIRFVKKEDLMVQAHCRLNGLQAWPLVVVVDLSSK